MSCEQPASRTKTHTPSPLSLVRFPPCVLVFLLLSSSSSLLLFFPFFPQPSMAGGFDPIDPERCAHYAGFAAHLDRRSFDFIYWFLFVAVIGMLFLASWKYSGLVWSTPFSPVLFPYAALTCACLYVQ